MPLYLAQHGPAMTEEENPDRPLTPDGETDVGQVVTWATSGPWAGVVAVHRVVHSGKTRARQTAEFWATGLGGGVTVEEAGALAPMDDPAVWAERLASSPDEFAGVPGLMVVGHLPHLARLTGLLLTGNPDATPVAFRPGGLVGLEWADGRWSVALVLPPPSM